MISCDVKINGRRFEANSLPLKKLAASMRTAKRIEREKVLPTGQRFFLVQWATANAREQHSWETSDSFPEDDPIVCDYRRAMSTSRSGVSTQTEDSFWISDHPPLLSEPDPFRNYAPPPTPSDFADVNIADRTVPTRIVRYNASKRTFSAVVADSMIGSEFDCDTLAAVCPGLVADFFLASQGRSLL
jgi:hypothetical protein